MIQIRLRNAFLMTKDNLHSNGFRIMCIIPVMYENYYKSCHILLYDSDHSMAKTTKSNDDDGSDYDVHDDNK